MPSKRGMVTPTEAAAKLQEKLAKEPPKGTRFKPETYMVVTRWTANTKLKYIPNPKTPGSKSYPRYEKYSQAKTVGEALSLGAYPPDLLWDYERGFYKITGGEMREEPVDVQKAQAEGQELTKTDLILGKWVLKELCKALGVDEKKLTGEATWSESGISRGLRLLSDREAANTIERAAAEGRAIRNEELLAVLRRWAYFKNPWRVNVMKEGQTWVNSDTVGLNCGRDGSVHITPPTESYKDVMRLLCQWMKDRQPAELKGVPFHFTSVNMNFGYAAQRHRDGNNTGLSMLAGFGDYTGGELRYWPDDPGSKAGANLDDFQVKDAITVDLKKELLLFDGRRAHEVLAFKGERYSLVWFSCARYWDAGSEALKKLTDLGFVIPTEAAVTSISRLLRPPGKPAVRGGGTEGALRWPSDRGSEEGAAAAKRGRGQAAPGEKRRKVATPCGGNE
eukprot:CAMPEP_0168365690 /NCGR_PEP_ID=MMETSP0228-20121227/4847_1 /TAXON_ID=133427 /ORGANISM="Protoceratium reticulatum, Strain CCCM 535 (=CCMP 1889)" /LENGTH=448 /DNA_ID=CAMNT_0008378477 /DNA_START=9 /DNA_END=1355 /DNA_ORIENTATION=+